MELLLRVVSLLWGAGLAAAVEADQTPVVGRKGTRCYDDFNRPQRCIPEFENAAFNLLMEATNTCGENGEMEFCIQTGVTNIRKSCQVCYPNQHHAKFLTDFHNPDNPTWWQSETMLEGIQYPNHVNLTLKFGKAFDVTYLRLWFEAPRPESLYISKKTTQDGPWIPWQYYSATCRDTYGLPDSATSSRVDESRAFCTSDYSDISPLRGGNVAFGTIEGRPSAYKFEDSPMLQEWVTATEIMITLDRINTFGDEVFGDEKVLRSYFYALADVAVGARCKCNGHAGECVASTGPEGARRRVCRCEHNTAGPDCAECLPFYNDAPWARANSRDAHECKQCDCNGYSNRCAFDKDLYAQTGHGGHCLDCAANRDGPNCERCRPNYYMREDGFCIACECSEVGSRSLQCNSEGKCHCKPGVAGDKCDRCAANFYEFTNSGCKGCNCSAQGSEGNEPNCDSVTGTCRCKENVEGKQCRECKPGFFNLDSENKFGCTPCFCYGHSSECNSAMGYTKYLLESTFAKSSERWKAENEYGTNVEIKYEGISQSIAVQANREEIVYFVAPDRFLGDQRGSYNQLLKFSLRTGDDKAIPTATDIILEGDGNSITTTIFAQNNQPLPSIKSREYSFRLHEHPTYQWQPRLTSREFVSLLTNLKAIKIRGTYSAQGVGFLDDFQLETAARGPAGQPALWIESCECPQGYVGQYCESCAPGYRHSPALGGPFMNCIPCDCNKHASICDSETGKCICQDNTSGENCELCARGYYGNALAGTRDDCQPCGCPNGGACIEIEDEIMCTECPVGYTGHRCDSCSDGYFGDPTGRFGLPSPCEVCECNLNIDTNAIGNCNTTTGECLKCIHYTGGTRCERCLPGFYGNALVLPKGDCKRCECYSIGTEYSEGEPICDSTTGHCNCKSHVVGKNCDQCEIGYYNLHSGEGCQPCNCDPVGAQNLTCDFYTGQCYCHLGVTGLRCDHCEARKYGFSTEGCKDCDCDPIGSKDLQCNASGQCPCLENVEGRTCDRCKENKYDRKRGCLDCPDCYNLVQTAARLHSNKLERLDKILDEVERRPTVISDDQFPLQLRNLQDDIDDFHKRVKEATDDDSIIGQSHDIDKRIKDISRVFSEIGEHIDVATNKNEMARRNIDNTVLSIEESEDRLADIETTLDTDAKKALDDAWERSQQVGKQSDKMSEMAKEARELADQIDKKAEDLVIKARDAKNNSIIAYETVKKAIEKQSQIGEEARALKNDLHNMELKLNNTKDWTKEVNEKARKAQNDSLAIYNEINNLIVPQIDIPALKVKSDGLREEAYRIGNKSAQLFKDAQKQREEIDERNRYGSELLERAYDQQDETTDLLNDIHAAKTDVDRKIEAWNKLLNDTESIYNDLKDSDSQTQKSKDEAEAALRSIADIESSIRDTISETANAQGILRDASEVANAALRKAQDADGLARNSSDVAANLKAKAEDLSANSTKLTDEVDEMQGRIDRTEEKLKNLITIARSNDTLVTEAKDKVGIAGKETDEVSKKVHELLGDVESILADLQSSPSVNDDDLDKLEDEIRRAEERSREAKLDEKLWELQQKHKEQNDLISEYTDEINRLQKDVNNIEQILKSLPDGCYRNVELEP